MTWIAFISSAFGLLAGFISAWLIEWWRERQLAASNLRILLFRIGKDLYHAEAQPFSIINPLYLDLMDCIWGYYRYCLPWTRRRFLSEGYRLIGHNIKTRHRHCHAYPSCQEASDAVESLLNLIGCPYEHGLPKTSKNA